MQKNNKLEQDLVNYFIEKIQRCARTENIPCDFIQIETGATAIGIPDALMFIGNLTFWIEFKRLTLLNGSVNLQNKSSNINGRIKFRPGQLRTLHRLNGHSERAFVCAITESQDAVFIHPDKLPLDGGSDAKIPKDCIMYDYPSVWEGLKTFLTKEFHV